jgi:hypothetical protein
VPALKHPTTKKLSLVLFKKKTTQSGVFKTKMGGHIVESTFENVRPEGVALHFGIVYLFGYQLSTH